MTHDTKKEGWGRGDVVRPLGSLAFNEAVRLHGVRPYIVGGTQTDCVIPRKQFEDMSAAIRASLAPANEYGVE